MALVILLLFLIVSAVLAACCIHTFGRIMNSSQTSDSHGASLETPSHPKSVPGIRKRHDCHFGNLGRSGGHRSWL